MPANAEYSNYDRASANQQKVAWEDDALCAQTDPEAFFPERGGSTRDAKKVCGKCDVGRQCLQHALDNNERFGIRGGMSERERRQLINKSREEVDRAYKAADEKNKRQS
jgi:WhiB family redox-sensing transcriptional regulator